MVPEIQQQQQQQKLQGKEEVEAGAGGMEDESEEERWRQMFEAAAEEVVEVNEDMLARNGQTSMDLAAPSHQGELHGKLPAQWSSYIHGLLRMAS